MPHLEHAAVLDLIILLPGDGELPVTALLRQPAFYSPKDPNSLQHTVLAEALGGFVRLVDDLLEKIPHTGPVGQPGKELAAEEQQEGHLQKVARDADDVHLAEGEAHPHPDRNALAVPQWAASR